MSYHYQRFIPFSSKDCTKLTLPQKEKALAIKSCTKQDSQQISEPKNISILPVQESHLFGHESSNSVKYYSEDLKVHYISDSMLQIKKNSYEKASSLAKQEENSDSMEEETNNNMLPVTSLPQQKTPKHRYYCYSVICNYCHKPGHYKSQCTNSNPHKVYKGAYTCYFCNQRGHIKKFCPKKGYEFVDGNEFNQYGQKKGCIFDITYSPKYPEIQY